MNSISLPGGFKITPVVIAAQIKENKKTPNTVMINTDENCLNNIFLTTDGIVTYVLIFNEFYCKLLLQLYASR